MLEDKSLVRRFNAGDPKALRRIYEKYRLDLFRVAGAVLHDPAVIEDVLHDVIVGFASQAGQFELRGSLKGYLAICVANRARNVLRQNRRPERCDESNRAQQPDTAQPLLDAELHQIVTTALASLPSEQNDRRGLMKEFLDRLCVSIHRWCRHGGRTLLVGRPPSPGQ